MISIRQTDCRLQNSAGPTADGDNLGDWGSWVRIPPLRPNSSEKSEAFSRAGRDGDSPFANPFAVSPLICSSERSHQMTWRVLRSRNRPNLEILVDTADFPYVEQHTWTVVSRKRSLTNYVTAMIDGRQVYLHRFILSAEAGQNINHKNGNGLDCRRENLEFLSQAENARHAWTIPNRFAGERFNQNRQRINKVRRKLASGAYRIHYYDRNTGEKIKVVDEGSAS
jgi:hypothetical protein